MKRIKVSNNVIRRMPRYLRKLDDLNAAGIERISSGELGRQMGLTPSQIRQDFSCFGEFGQQGYGYNVVALRGEVAKILGMDRNYSAVLVGVGNIGRALVENFCFEQYGFTLKAAFDINPDLIGKEMHGIVCMTSPRSTTFLPSSSRTSPFSVCRGPWPTTSPMRSAPSA